MMYKHFAFTVRTYGRTELAQLYYPNVCADTAWRKLKQLIAEQPALADALRRAGYTAKRRTFTPHQVELITQSLGSPYNK